MLQTVAPKRSPGWHVPLLGMALGVLLSPWGCARSNPRLLADAEVPDDAHLGACGDGVLDPGEECDDGNQVAGDGCSPACTLEVCSADTCATGCCDPTGLCRDGAQDLACGTAGVPCQSCIAQELLCQDGACQDPGPCDPGDTLDCGNCGQRSCSTSGAWGPCDSQGECGPGQVIITGACGLCGELSRTCKADCTYDALECLNEGECHPGTLEQGESCGTCSRMERTCSLTTCTFGPWECVSHQECAPGLTETADPCGNCGHEERTCTSGCTWTPWECTGEGDCAPLDTSTEGCTCGQKTCTAGCLWGPCQTFVEECNGLDDDCNGVCDDGPNMECCQGTSGTCTTSCGSQGNHSCSSTCAWGPCQPPAEVCNGVDDNCDGVVDEGWRAAQELATYTLLSSYHGTCDGSSQRFGLACNQAIHAWCHDRGCPVSGFGPIENSGDQAYVTCVAGASVRTVAWTTLQQVPYQPDCNLSTAISGGCYSAYHRYCRDQGYGSGFGPILADSAGAQIACVTGVTLHATTYTVMEQKHPGCEGTNQAWGMNCNAAIKRYCVDSGHTSGFGPVEHSGNNLTVSCVDP